MNEHPRDRKHGPRCERFVRDAGFIEGWVYCARCRRFYEKEGKDNG